MSNANNGQNRIPPRFAPPISFAQHLQPPPRLPTMAQVPPRLQPFPSYLPPPPGMVVPNPFMTTQNNPFLAPPVVLQPPQLFPAPAFAQSPLRDSRSVLPPPPGLPEKPQMTVQLQENLTRLTLDRDTSNPITNVSATRAESNSDAQSEASASSPDDGSDAQERHFDDNGKPLTRRIFKSETERNEWLECFKEDMRLFHLKQNGKSPYSPQTQIPRHYEAITLSVFLNNRGESAQPWEILFDTGAFAQNPEERYDIAIEVIERGMCFKIDSERKALAAKLVSLAVTGDVDTGRNVDGLAQYTRYLYDALHAAAEDECDYQQVLFESGPGADAKNAMKPEENVAYKFWEDLQKCLTTEFAAWWKSTLPGAQGALFDPKSKGNHAYIESAYDLVDFTIDMYGQGMLDISTIHQILACLVPEHMTAKEQLHAVYKIVKAIGRGLQADDSARFHDFMTNIKEKHVSIHTTFTDQPFDKDSVLTEYREIASIVKGWEDRAEHLYQARTRAEDPKYLPPRPECSVPSTPDLRPGLWEPRAAPAIVTLRRDNSFDSIEGSVQS